MNECESYDFMVVAYVVMPEHVHLLLTEPKHQNLATALQALKLSVSVQSEQRPYWQKRYYDFNVFTEDKRVEKLRYLHRNPVKRGLVAQPQDWPWSSFLHYATAKRFTVEIASEATAAQQERLAAQTHISEAKTWGTHT